MIWKFHKCEQISFELIVTKNSSSKIHLPNKEIYLYTPHIQVDEHYQMLTLAHNV